MLNVVSNPSPLATTTVFDRSGIVTTGGTAQTLMNARPDRLGFVIQNTSTSDLWICETTSASAGGSSFRLAPYDLYTSSLVQNAATTWSVFGVTTSQSFAAREW